MPRTGSHSAAWEGEGVGWLTQPASAWRSGAEPAGSAQLMIIINSEQTLARQPAGSGRMPGSPTVRFKNKTQGSRTRRWQDGDHDKGGTGQRQGVGQGSPHCERVGTEEAQAGGMFQPMSDALRAQRVRLDNVPRRRAPAIQQPPPRPLPYEAQGKQRFWKRWGLGAPEPRIVILLPSGSGYKNLLYFSRPQG